MLDAAEAAASKLNLNACATVHVVLLFRCRVNAEIRGGKRLQTGE